ncbi:MAG: carboxypeptidase-like regulatory domain-containing protein [Opitutus sp.]|nr:carboxypeptidase-like regulatory domain-containing protein [Opitutus sp.]
MRIVALSALIAVGDGLRADDTSIATGTISGTVIEAGTHHPVERAQASLDGTSLHAFTDRSGAFMIAGAPAGARKLTVTFNYPTMEAAYVPVAVETGKTATVRVELLRQSISFTEIAARLELSIEQRPGCAAVLQELNAKSPALRYDTTFEPAARRTALEAARAAATNGLRGSLRMDQFETWLAMIASPDFQGRRILFDSPVGNKR